MELKAYPLVSIIVPMYNAQEWIVGLLHSIVNQTYQNIEVILVNDGLPFKFTSIYYYREFILFTTSPSFFKVCIILLQKPLIVGSAANILLNSTNLHNRAFTTSLFGVVTERGERLV